MNNKIISATPLILLLLTSIIAWQMLGSEKKAPDVMFMTITGKKISLSNLKGKPVVVTFWATDCPACVKEIPLFIDLYNKFHQQGLEIIAVAMTYNPPNLVVKMSKTYNIPYEIALDPRSEIAKKFGNISAIPHTFLISADGQIIMDKLGLFDINKLSKLITNNLKS